MDMNFIFTQNIREIREAFTHGEYETCTGIFSLFVEEASDLLKASALRQFRALSASV